MACSSLIALPRACGTEGVVAGTSKLYMIAFSDLNPLSASTTGDVYSATTGGTVVSIGLDAGKKFVEIGLLRDTTGLDSALTKDLQKGVAFFTHTLTTVLSDLSSANWQFVTSVVNQPVAIIIKTKTNNYYAAGLNGLFELATAQGGSGIQNNDLIGYTLSFTGVETHPIQMVDSSIISGLI